MSTATAGLGRLFVSSLGRKALLAVSGLLLCGFLIVHAAGNLLVFGGQQAMNDYAAWLKSKPLLLWGARLVLLGLFLLHVRLGIQLQMENRRARPSKYVMVATSESTGFGRSMLLTGLLVAVYVVYHLLHFTIGVVQPSGHALRDGVGRPDVHGMVVSGFGNPFVALSYVAAMVVLGMHLSHGVSSLLQTLGIHDRRYARVVRRTCLAFTVLLVLTFLSVPCAVLLGALKATS